MNLRQRLFVGSIVGLAALNVFIFKPFTIIAAAALVAAAVLCLKALTPRYVGPYAFLVAEISPGGLHASLLFAIAYQALCILLLVSVLSVRENVNSLAVYKNALPQIAVLAIIPFVIFLVIVQTGAVALSANQIMACAVAVLLAVLCIMLAAANNEKPVVEGARP